MRSVLLLLLVAACGRLELEALGASDAAGGVATDAPFGDFAPPDRVIALSDPLTDDDPTATADALELYFRQQPRDLRDAALSVADNRRRCCSRWSAPWRAKPPR